MSTPNHECEPEDIDAAKDAAWVFISAGVATRHGHTAEAADILNAYLDQAPPGERVVRTGLLVCVGADVTAEQVRPHIPRPTKDDGYYAFTVRDLSGELLAEQDRAPHVTAAVRVLVAALNDDVTNVEDLTLAHYRANGVNGLVGVVGRLIDIFAAQLDTDTTN